MRHVGATRAVICAARRVLRWLALRGSPPGNRALPVIWGSLRFSASVSHAVERQPVAGRDRRKEKAPTGERLPGLHRNVLRDPNTVTLAASGVDLIKSSEGLA